MNIACVVSHDNLVSSSKETIDIIKNTGFKKVFIQWYDDDRFNLNQYDEIKYLKENNLEIIFAHLGYQNINDIWEDKEEGDLLVKRYKKNIKELALNGVNMVVMHLTSHNEAPLYNMLGIKRLRKICAYAKRYNVKIAFENTKIKGYIEYVAKHIRMKNVGFCLDFGHMHCHFDDDYPFDKVKNRIFAVHIHDNYGEKDEHLLPFEGTIDFKDVLSKLKESGYNGDITMEIVYQNDYKNMDINLFYKKGYEKAIELEKLYKTL